MDFDPHLLAAGVDISSTLDGDVGYAFRESLGAVTSDQEIFRDLQDFTGSKSKGGDSTRSGCGCESGCGCGDCQCISGGKAVNSSDPIEDILSKAVGRIHGLEESNPALNGFAKDLESALRNAFGSER